MMPGVCRASRLENHADVILNSDWSVSCERRVSHVMTVDTGLRLALAVPT